MEESIEFLGAHSNKPTECLNTSSLLDDILKEFRLLTHTWLSSANSINNGLISVVSADFNPIDMASKVALKAFLVRFGFISSAPISTSIALAQNRPLYISKTLG